MSIVSEFLADEIADLIDPPDPFLIDHDCSNAAGHYPVRMHGEIVCPHCSRVIWQ
jgi:hypothetical protein